jgi:hypothetical protein
LCALFGFINALHVIGPFQVDAFHIASHGGCV